MPKTTFKKSGPVIEDFFGYIKLQNIGELTIQDKESRLLRHTFRKQNGDIVAVITSKDPTALDSNSIEISDPSVYWLFYDFASRYEEEFKPNTVAIKCNFREDQIPQREA